MISPRVSPEIEIQITPEMIDAGIEALLNNHPDRNVSDLHVVVSAVFLAMARNHKKPV